MISSKLAVPAVGMVSRSALRLVRRQATMSTLTAADVQLHRAPALDHQTLSDLRRVLSEVC